MIRNWIRRAHRCALSIEGRDFEQEKSLDKRSRGSGAVGRVGRLWINLLLCRQNAAAERNH
jgi:hypothetical protein